MLNLLIGPIANLAGTWLDGKVEKTKAEAATKVAKAKAEAVIMERKATGEIDWDLEMAKGSQSSWKDEWLTILFSIPLIMAFIPGMEEVVANGFAQLNEMPEWYQYSLGVIVAASFGVRSATKFFGKKQCTICGTCTTELQKSKRGLTVTVAMERILAWKILPRLMMIMMSISAWRVVEWFMTLPDPTNAQAGLVSVVTGAMTGAFAVWLGNEK